MSKKSPLRDAIGNIEPGKPRVLPKDQHFAPPLPKTLKGHLPQVKQTQGSLPQGEGTQGQLPQGNLPQGKSTSEINSEFINVDGYLSQRKKKRREALTESALSVELQLAQEFQERLVKQHFAEGWGRLAHCVTRQLKAPTRFGLKLVDVSLILTVYDKTIAQVIPRMYAPIITKEFEEDTGMDASNIRAALRSLLAKAVLTKITYKTLNFWGLNHAYFDPKNRGHLPQVKQTQGSLPQGNAPCDNEGDLPQVEVGQITPPQAASSDRDHSELLVPKNLKKESKKESLSCANEFPEDMKARWKDFDLSGKFGNTTKEKEIFKALLIAHGDEFSSNCGRVVNFLEEQGSGKPGDEGKVYNPIAYLRGHWEHNLGRYQSWLKSQDELKASQAKKAEQEAQKAESEKQKAREVEEQAAQEAQTEAEMQRLRKMFRLESELNAFAEEAIQESQCEFTLRSWRNQGWHSPVVKCCVISRFLRLEEAQKLANCPHSVAQAIA